MNDERSLGVTSETTNQHTQITSEQLAGSVSNYLDNIEQNSVLREHQVEVFEDLEQFFVNRHQRGYIELPTGTGKTVLFVELAKALLNTENGEPKPNILVVTPTQDLVRQTIGQSGTKGFGGFASELTVRPYYGLSSQKDREEFTSADVGITTYHSLEKLQRARDFVPARELGAAAVSKRYQKEISNFLERAVNRKDPVKDPRAYALRGAQKFMQKKYNGEFIGEPMLEKFDIIFLDEAHHALPGTAAWFLIERVIAKNKIVIGFTATPDANSERQLSKVLPEKIHSLSLSEAIDMNLLSPMVPIAIKSGVRIEGSEIYNAYGEYVDDKISYLARSKERNDIILNAAEVFVEHGVGTIISCIAGGTAQHARELAESLVERGVRAVAVYSEISAKDRADIYQQFEDGEIDVLTFIGVLGEGWDSNRAKAIINARPTRSPVFATQRPGRIARPGGVAFTVDIYDEYETGNPPINVADILSSSGAEYGEAFGVVTEEQRMHINVVLSELKTATPTMDHLKSAYRSYQEMLASVPKLQGGKTIIDGREYVVPKRTSSAYSGVTEEILLKAAEIKGSELSCLDAESNGLMRTVFDRAQSTGLLRTLPIVSLEKYHIDQDHTKWISSTGLAALFIKRYPEATSSIVDTTLLKTNESLEWLPARTVKNNSKAQYVHYKTVRMYKVTQETLKIIDGLLKELFVQ